MKPAATTVLLLLGGCSMYVPPAEAPPLVVARGPLRVVRAPSSAAPTVSLVVRAGSAYDPPSREGLAFVVAHALASRAGPNARVDVGPELVHLSVPAPEAVALRAALAAPVDADALDYARDVALSRLRPTDCEAWAATAAPTWIFAGHPYGHPAPGRLSTLPTLTLPEAQAFRDARWVRDAAVLALDGTIDGSSLPSFDDVFAPILSRSPTPAVRPREPVPDLVVEAPVASACLAWGPRRLPDTTVSTRALLRRAQLLTGADLVARVDPYGLWVGPAAGDGLDAWRGWAPPATAAGAGGPPSASTSAPHQPTAAELAAGVLVDGIFGLAPSAEVLGAAERVSDEELAAFAKSALSRDETVRLVVTPSAERWRAVESSPTFVVLDHEALVR